MTIKHEYLRSLQRTILETSGSQLPDRYGRLNFDESFAIIAEPNAPNGPRHTVVLTPLSSALASRLDDVENATIYTKWSYRDDFVHSLPNGTLLNLSTAIVSNIKVGDLGWRMHGSDYSQLISDAGVQSNEVGSISLACSQHGWTSMAAVGHPTAKVNLQDIADVTWRVMWNSSTTGAKLWCGVSSTSNFSGSMDRTARFVFDHASGSTWLFETVGTGAPTVTDTSIQLTADTWYKLHWEYDGDETYTAYIDDVQVAQHTQGTDGTCTWSLAMSSSNATAGARSVSVGYFGINGRTLDR